MNITLIKILIAEVFILSLILLPIIYFNIKVNRLTKIIKSNNKGLRELIETLRSIFKLSGEYVDIVHNSLKEKISSLVIFIGEIASYSIMRRIFAQSYKNFVIGFNIARLFW